MPDVEATLLRILLYSRYSTIYTQNYCIIRTLLFDSIAFWQVNHTKRDLHNFLIRKLYRCISQHLVIYFLMDSSL